MFTASNVEWVCRKKYAKSLQSQVIKKETLFFNTSKGSMSIYVALYTTYNQKKRKKEMKHRDFIYKILKHNRFYY